MKTIFIILSILTSSFVFSQNKVKYNFLTSEKIIKIDFNDFFSQTPTVGVDIESKVNDELSLQFGFGVLPSFIQPLVGSDDNRYNHLRGYQLRAESRFYIFKKSTRYIAADIQFRHLIVKDNDVPVGMDLYKNPNGIDEFAYFIDTKMKFHQFKTSLAVKWGFQKDLGEKFVFDFNIGLRINKINVQSFSKLPSGGTLQANWNDNINFGNNLTLIDNYRRSNIRPTIGFKFGYRL